ncbi:MAG: type II secretion system protein [Synergistaceae bacterium]|nr:type II secretion system protein [Synergistaceae bacterium]
MEKKKGFTLTELLVALVITAILASLAFISYSKAIEKAEETACLANKKTIARAYGIYRQQGGKEKSLAGFIAADYDGLIGNSSAKCPSGGSYYAASDDAGRDSVLCTLHDEKVNGGAAGNIIPGTGDFGGSGISATDKWENAVKSEHRISFTEGEKFEYDGKYYVATETLDNIYYNGDSSPGQSVWWTEKSGGGLVEATGVSKDWNSAEVTSGTTFRRGDIVYYDGSYYICKIGGGQSFTVEKGEYHTNSPDWASWAWYRL